MLTLNGLRNAWRLRWTMIDSATTRPLLTQVPASADSAERARDVGAPQHRLERPAELDSESDWLAMGVWGNDRGRDLAVDSATLPEWGSAADLEGAVEMATDQVIAALGLV